MPTTKLIQTEAHTSATPDEYTTWTSDESTTWTPDANNTWTWSQLNTTTSVSSASNVVDYYAMLTMYVVKYIPPFILFLGIIGNVLCIIVLQSKHFRKYPTRILLTALALVDTAVLSNSVVYIWSYALSDYTFDFRVLSSASCKVQTTLTYILLHLSVWILSLVNIERVICVCFPFKVKELCSKKRLITALVTLCVLLISFDLCIPWITEIDHVDNWCTDMPGKDTFILVFNWINFALSSVLPCTIIGICNLIIICMLRRRSLNTKLKADDRNTNQSSNSITGMLIVTSLVFLICWVPIDVCYLVWYYVQAETYDSGDEESWAVFLFITEILNVFCYVNNAVNFLLYCLSGRTFRKAVLELFCRQKSDTRSQYGVRSTNISTVSQSQ